MSRPSFYLAAASAEIERAEAVRDALIARGFRCAFDWCAHMRKHVRSGAPLTIKVARNAAGCDFSAAGDHAEFFAILVPPPTIATTGAWVELGARLALLHAHPAAADVYAVALADDYKRCIFLAMPEIVRVDTDAALVDLLCRDAMAEGYEVRL